MEAYGSQWKFMEAERYFLRFLRAQGFGFSFFRNFIISEKTALPATNGECGNLANSDT